MPEGQIVNTGQGSEFMNQANNTALQVYYDAKLRGEADELAFRKAQQAWKETMDRATMTGFFEGSATMPTQMNWANMFGTWGTPEQGAQTLAAQQQAFNKALGEAGLLGTYQGQQTMAAQQQNFNQALAAAQEARQNQALQQQTANQYLTLLSNMRGPQNYFQYQNVLGATPGGMKDLVGAAMGQYIPGGGATSGQQPMAQSLQGLANDVTGAGQVYNQQQSALASKLPAPNQLSAQAWNNMAPSQRQLLMSAYESQGWNADDVKGLFEQSLPKYGSQTPAGAGTFRLQ